MTRLLLGLLLVAGCLAAPPETAGTPSATRAFTDDTGRTVQVPTHPEHVVPLAPSITEVLAAAGGLGQMAARTPYCDVPAAAARLPTIATYPLDREALVALGADLVVGTDQINDPAEGDALGALGVPAVYFHFGTLADVPRVIRTVGTMLGTTPTAEAAAQQFEARLAAVRPASGPRPRTLVLIGDGPLYAFGGASYVHDMVRRAGGEPMTAVFPGESVTLSSEWVLEHRPERIVMLAGTGYNADSLAARQPSWTGLSALAAGHVCGVGSDLVVRPGPRLVLGVEALRACLGDAPAALTAR